MKRTAITRYSLLRHAVLLLLAVSGIFAGSLKAQEQIVTLPAARLTVKDAIYQIESQAGLIVGVNHSNFDVQRYITAKSTRLTVDDLLEQIVAGSDHTYIRKDRHVIIVSEDKPRAAKKVAVVENTPANPLTQAQIEELIKAMELSLKPDDKPEPEVITYRTVSYRDLGLSLSFSAQDPDRFTPVIEKQPMLSLKTNLAYGLATLTPNLGIEFGVGRRTSIEICGGWNPWKLDGKMSDSENREVDVKNREVDTKDNRKLVHLYVQPEFRWWLCERFNGHFFGAHVVGAAYNISGHKLPLIGFEKDYRYQGYAVGAGVSYGYALMLAPVVNLEFTLGLGVWWLTYDRYECMKCARDYQSFDKFRFAPTKAGISLSFIIK